MSWYTQGQTKCDACGGYYPEAWGSHGRACPNYVEEED